MHDDAASAPPTLARAAVRETARVRAILFVCLLFFPVPLFAAHAAGERGSETEFAEANAAFARGDFGRAASLYAGLTRLRLSSDIYWLNYGSALVELRRYEEAIGAFRKAIRMNQSLRHAAALLLAEAYRRAGDLPRAKKTADWLVKQPQLPPPIFAAALELATYLEEQAHAKTEFDELVNRGIWRYKSGKYPEAYSALQGALQIRRAPEVFFLTALAHMEMGDYDAARTVLDNLLATSADQELARAARTVREEIRTARRKRLFLNTEAGGEWESTAYKAFSAESTSLAGQLRVGYRLLESEEWAITPRYRGKWNQLLFPTSTTLFTHNLGAALNYHATNGWLLEFRADLELNHFADELFLLRSMLGWTLGHRWASAQLAFSLTGIANTAKANAYDYLQGPSGVGELEWAHFGEGGTWALFARYGVDATEDSVISPSSIVPVANAKAEIGEAGRVRLGKNVALKQGLSVAHKRYERLAYPEQKLRRDLRFTGNLGFSYRESLSSVFDLDFAYIVNNSNMNVNSASDQRYRELAVRVSALWDLMP